MDQGKWVTDLAQFNMVPLQYQEWLSKPFILSKALKRVSASITVKVLEQRFTEAIADEYSILAIKQNILPFVRQVFLLSDNDLPLTYGRVVIPPHTYQAHFQDFEKLGSNLIGETMLYNNPDVVRSAFEFACFATNSALAAFIYQHLTMDVLKTDLWARRSVFYLKGQPLLVTELFLPFLPAYIPEHENDI